MPHLKVAFEEGPLFSCLFMLYLFFSILGIACKWPGLVCYVFQTTCVEVGDVCNYGMVGIDNA